MGESSAATVREIEDIRDRLETNVQELERRLPAPAILGKRLAGIAIGGGIGALVLRSLLTRGSKAGSTTQPVETAARVVKGGSRRWAVLAAGALIAVHVVQLRQLRQLNRSLIEGSS
ncbi:MAG: hypothetical protein ACRDHM_11300 [Actinomycetota bacterium]